MSDEITNINKKIKDGDIIITDEVIINNQDEKSKHVDAITGPTMSMKFINISRKYLEEKEKKKKQGMEQKKDLPSED